MVDSLLAGPLERDAESFGLQVFLRHGSEEVSFATGAATVGDDLRDSHSFNLYCGGKPFEVASFLAAIEAAGVPCGPGTLLSELLRRPTETTANLGDLLSHALDLGKPDLFTFLNTRQADRASLIPADSEIAASARRAEYSAIAAPAALDRILQVQLGRSLSDVVNDAAENLGLRSVFCRREHPSQIATYVDSSNGRSWPMLHDQLPLFHDSRWGALIGLYGSASECGAWLTRLFHPEQRQLCAQPGLPSPGLLESYFGPWLECLERPASPAPAFAGGFALLSTHGLRCGPATLGHFGFVRSSMSLVNPHEALTFFAITRDLRMHELDTRLEIWQGVIDVLDGNQAS